HRDLQRRFRRHRFTIGRPADPVGSEELPRHCVSPQRCERLVSEYNSLKMPLRVKGHFQCFALPLKSTRLLTRISKKNGYDRSPSIAFSLMRVPSARSPGFLGHPAFSATRLWLRLEPGWPAG